MKYTFEKNGKQKTVDIDDKWLQKTKLDLKLSTKEAIDLWLFDNGHVENAEADALTAKAKGAGTGVRGKSGKARKPRERKPDEVKRALVRELYNCISEYAGVQSPQVTNIERQILFTLGEDTYEITLSKKRKPKA